MNKIKKLKTDRPNRMQLGLNLQYLEVFAVISIINAAFSLLDYFRLQFNLRYAKGPPRLCHRLIILDNTCTCIRGDRRNAGVAFIIQITGQMSNRLFLRGAKAHSN